MLRVASVVGAYASSGGHCGLEICHVFDKVGSFANLVGFVGLVAGEKHMIRTYFPS